MEILHYSSRPDTRKWEPYLKYGKRIFLKRKSIIYNEGNKGNGFYFVNKGLIKIVTSTLDGEEKIIDVSGAGYIFGEQALDEKPYFTTAIAVEDSIVYYLDSEVFRELIPNHPELINLFVSSVIGKVNILAEEITTKMFTSEQHIAYRLLKLSQVSGKYEIPFTQQEIANYTGLTRITVYKTLKKWREEDIIDVRNRTVLIKKPETLIEYLS